MSTDFAILLVLIELIGILFLGLMAALWFIRRLKRRIRELDAQHLQNTQDLQDTQHPQKPTAATQATQGPFAEKRPAAAPKAPERSYLDYLDEKLRQTRSYHQKMAGPIEIGLDLALDTPMTRRIIALRHAVLIAEREAHLGGGTLWSAIAQRYKTLFQYYDDYEPPKLGAEIKQLKSTLAQQTERLSHLDQYKGLYLDLESTWQQKHTEAENYYQALTSKLDQLTEADSTDLRSLVNAYHQNYQTLDQSFAGKNPLPITLETATHEILNLRHMADEQSRLIAHLQQQIQKATSDNEKVTLIRQLEQQLEKQQRFMKESEVCIKLMEDELTNTTKELQLLKQKVKEVPHLRAQLKEFVDERGLNRLMIDRLKDEVRNLKNRQAQPGTDAINPNPSVPYAADYSPDDAQKTAILQDSLAQLQKQYAALEERYLDLQLKG